MRINRGILRIPLFSACGGGLFALLGSCQQDSSAARLQSAVKAEGTFELVAEHDTYLKVVDSASVRRNVPNASELPDSSKCFIPIGARVAVLGNPTFVANHVRVVLANTLDSRPASRPVVEQKNSSPAKVSIGNGRKPNGVTFDDSSTTMALAGNSTKEEKTSPSKSDGLTTTNPCASRTAGYLAIAHFRSSLRQFQPPLPPLEVEAPNGALFTSTRSIPSVNFTDPSPAGSYDLFILKNNDNRDAPVPAPCGGIVTSTETLSGYGPTIEVACSDDWIGTTTFQAHFNSVKVSKGDLVKRGDVIGLQGDIGNMGCEGGVPCHHVHMEFYSGGNRITNREVTEPLLQQYLSLIASGGN